MTRRVALILITLVGVALLAVALIATGTPLVSRSPSLRPGQAQEVALASNPNVDPGTPLSGPAPDFTLSDQFGRSVSLHSFRGRVVILAFNDSECTTVCPLTTTAMLDAKAMLGPAARQVQLLGIDANPSATTVGDVLAYSRVHGMLTKWQFLTASPQSLTRVWRDYHIYVQIAQGQIDHTPALYVIDRRGNLSKVYMTQMSYDSVAQQGQVLAQEAASLLPSHPALRAVGSFAQILPITPRAAISLPRAGGGSTRLGSGGSPHLLLFFASWDSEITNLGSQLDALNRYQSQPVADRPASLTAVDEASVEPSSAALPALLRGLRAPLSYPVAIDRSGRVADGYQAQDEPWFVLSSSSGRILWYWDVSTQGWLSAAALDRHVRAALRAPPPAKPPAAAVAARALNGSPASLAALHAQSSKLLGGQSALTQRLRALRGYPVVINAWASWCTPCQKEFPLFSSASLRYGRQVAFLGVDVADTSGAALSFLTGHPVSYPSYQSAGTDLGSLVNLDGLPTTIYLDRSGKIVSVHTGQYDSQGTLDEDIGTYALGG